jgi:3-oxoacyl-[acyl-carrier-protein] synthase-3
VLILCTTTPDELIPANSAPVAAALGVHRGAMDINAACAGFTYGLVTSSALIGAGATRVLLIGAETLTRATNWSDRTNAFLFGDGAGAVVLEAIPGDGCLLGWDLGVDGTLVPLLRAHHGSGMAMRGKEVFRRAVLATAESARSSLEKAKLTIDDIALFVPHQANIRIMEAAATRLGIDHSRIASVIDRTGNTSSASIPLALVDAIETGRLSSGDNVLFAGFGAGMTWASAVWRWEGA